MQLHSWVEELEVKLNMIQNSKSTTREKYSRKAAVNSRDRGNSH